MIPTLPYDVWTLIADFIPEDALVKLYAVNAAFFHRAMTLLYQEVVISHLDNRETLKSIKNLGTTAHYVRSLIMHPYTLGQYMYGASDLRGILSEALWRVHDRVDSRAIPQGAAAARMLLRDVCKIKNITKLKVIYECTDQYPYFVTALPLVKGALLSSGTRIQELYLDIPVESYALILTPSLKLSNLETLSITIRPHHISEKSDDNNYIADILVPFIHRHRYTLQHIVIDTPTYGKSSFDLSPLFIGLHARFPHLTSISMSVPLESLYTPGFQILLANHSDIIQELKLAFYPQHDDHDDLIHSDNMFFFPIFKIPLVELHSLDLDLWMLGQFGRQSTIQGLIEYLLPLQHSLSTLILREYTFSAGDLREFLQMCEHSFQRLSHLQICVRYLSVDIIDILASHLPGLSRLSITFNGLGGNRSDIINDQTPRLSNIQSFNNSIKSRRYHKWSLQNIELALEGNVAGRWNESLRLITQALPSDVLVNS